MSKDKEIDKFSSILLKDKRSATLSDYGLVIINKEPKETKGITMNKESAIVLANWILKECDKYE